jgi:hypothetical protein
VKTLETGIEFWWNTTYTRFIQSDRPDRPTSVHNDRSLLDPQPDLRRLAVDLLLFTHET